MCFVKRLKGVIGLGSTARKVLNKRSTFLSTSLKKAMRKCVSERKVFIRNDKNLLTRQKPWVEKESIEVYNKMKDFMHPYDISYKEIQQNFVEKINENRTAHNFNTFKNLKSEREKWNFRNEARNSKNSKTEILALKNVFGDIYTDQQKIVNLLN